MMKLRRFTASPLSAGLEGDNEGLNMANVVQIAAKMYECRDTARRLLGNKYPDRMRELGQAIKALSKEKSCSNLEAGKRIAESSGGGMVAILVMAATVEIIEPSNTY